MKIFIFFLSTLAFVYAEVGVVAKAVGDVVVERFDTDTKKMESFNITVEKISYQEIIDAKVTLKDEKSTKAQIAKAQETVQKQKTFYLLPKDIVTVGKDSYGLLEFLDGTKIELIDDSRFKIYEYRYRGKDKNSKGEFILSRGSALISLGKLQDGNYFKTRSAFFTIESGEVLATILNSKDKLIVAEGKTLVGAGGKSITLEKNEVTSITLGAIPTDPAVAKDELSEFAQTKAKYGDLKAADIKFGGKNAIYQY